MEGREWGREDLKDFALRSIDTCARESPCTATAIALRAAELGTRLDRLAVRVESRSDNRGFVGVPGLVDACPRKGLSIESMSVDRVKYISSADIIRKAKKKENPEKRTSL